MRSAERRKVNVLEMKCLRSLVGVSRMDRVRNDEVRRRAGIERELASRTDQRVLRWFGHVEIMDEYRMARMVLMAEVSGGRVRGRPRLGWMYCVKVALGNDGRGCATMREKIGKGGEPWYGIHMYLNEFHAAIFAWHCVLRTALPCSGGYDMERGRIPLHDAVGIKCETGSNTEHQGSAVKYMG